ncbi:hypothetical protein Tco_1183200 [Tanacetum coccineum]
MMQVGSNPALARELLGADSVHVLDLTNGKTVYMFVDKVYPIRATLLERMLRHRLTVPPSYCRDVVVAGNVIQTVQAGLRESYECLASVPIACTARQMVFSSPWLTAKKESGSPLQTALGTLFEITLERPCETSVFQQQIIVNLHEDSAALCALCLLRANRLPQGGSLMYPLLTAVHYKSSVLAEPFTAQCTLPSLECLVL